jgi:hypothetical protein
MNYPDNWPCTCGHKLKEHTYGGMNSLGWGGCSIKKVKGLEWMDGCGMFHPIDNLTYVEILANARTTSL